MGPLRRGDLVTAVLPRALGKPRPALVVQEDSFDALPTVTVLPLTSALRPEHLLRVSVEPGGATGLALPSQVQIDKATTIRRERVGRRIGALEQDTLAAVDEALGRFLGLR